MSADSMALVFLFPTTLEAVALQSLRPDLDVRICGVGPIETARYVAKVLEEKRCDGIILCGIAGAYDGSLSVGDVVAVGKEQMASLPAPFRASYEATMSLALPQVVSNTVTAVGCESLGAQIENMEGAALFALCGDAGVPCAEIRAISNRVDDERKDWRIELAVDNLTQAIDKLFPR